MYLIYCDETNLNAKDGDFFIYGGIAIDFSRALELSNRLQQIRSEYKVPKDFKLKFAPPPEQVLAEDFNHLKQQYIEAAIQCGSKFLVSMIHSNIMTNAEDARLNEINRIAYHYNCLLTRENTHGLFILDRFNSKDIDEHIRTKASSGIEGMPYSKEFPLDRIVGFHYSAIGQSHFTSLSDILIGTFRFVINAITKNEEKKFAISKHLLGIIDPLFLKNKKGECSEISVFFSPKTVKAKKFRDEYQKIHSFLSESGCIPEQEITGERNY